MILIEKTVVGGFAEAIRGMRNPMNSWEKSDSFNENELNEFAIGINDHELMMKLAKEGPVHGKFRRMIVVYADITAPLYWWKEFDTYKVGTVVNSCSTMHKIHANDFTIDDFSCDHLMSSTLSTLSSIVKILNISRQSFLETREKTYWWQMIQLLPSSYNQKRTVMMNYEVLANIYQYRREHKLDEWRDLCSWVKELPCSEIITCGVDKK